MADNVIKSLDIGSGLDTKAIVDALVDSQKSPKQKAIQANLDSSNVKISSIGTIKSDLNSISTSLTSIDGTTGLSIASTGSAVTAVISDSALATSFEHDFTVTRLAKSQTLVFGNYNAATSSLGAGSLAFEFGTWAGGSFTKDSSVSTSTVTISSSANTLEDIAGEINNANIGVTASVILTSSGNYSLVMRASTGADNAMRITATETSAGSGLAALGYTSYSASTEAVAGADAAFTIDGVSVTRESNSFTDLVDGVTVTLASTTSSSETLSGTFNTDTAKAAMKSMVDDINTLISTLQTQSKRGIYGAESGPLAGDPLVKSMLDDIRGFTTSAITGFGSSSVYLAEFGIETNRDGSLSIDENDFEDAFEANPSSFSAIMNSRVTTSSSLVTGTINSSSSYTPGSYAFDLSAATLGGNAMTVDSGNYYMSSGNAVGLKLSLSGSGEDATIYIGKSLLEQIQDWSETLLESTGDLEDRVSDYNLDVSDYTIELSTLDAEMEKIRERYLVQFGEMDAAVASFKRTGESLTAMMDAWRDARR